MIFEISEAQVKNVHSRSVKDFLEQLAQLLSDFIDQQELVDNDQLTIILQKFEKLRKSYLERWTEAKIDAEQEE